MEKVTREQVLEAVASGTMDDCIEDIWNELRERSKIVRAAAARRMANEVKVGDRVRIKANVRPKYLIGREVTVLKVTGHKLIVEFEADPDLRRFNGSKNSQVLASMVEAV